MGRMYKQKKLQKKQQAVRTPVHKTPEKAKSNDRTKKLIEFIEKYPFGIMLFLLSATIFFVFQDFITLDKVFLYKDIASDSINTYFPNFYQSLANKGSGLSYSFSYSMGSGVASDFSFIDRVMYLVFHPFHIWYDFATAENSQYMRIVGVLSNICYTAILFFFYLRIINFEKYSSIMGSLIMAFAGFMIIDSMWGNFTEMMPNLLLVLISFELMFKRKIWFLFPIIIAYIGNIYFFFHTTFFLIFYVIFRYFDEEDFSVGSFAKYIGKVGGLTLLGLLIKAPYLYNSLISLYNHPRVSGDVSMVSTYQKVSIWATGDFIHNITALYRFFGNDLLGTGKISKEIINGKQYLIPDFKGYSNYYEAPMFYIGLISLILVPQAIIVSNFKKKVLYSLALLLWLFPVVIPHFRYAMYFFLRENYHALSIFLCFTILFIALSSLKEIHRFNIPTLIVSISVLLFLLFFNWFDDATLKELSLFESPVKTKFRNITALFIIIYGILIALIYYYQEYKSVLKIVLLLTVCIELIYVSNITVNDRDIVSSEEFKSKVGYNDYTIEAVEYLKSIDKSFYRMEKDYQSGNAVHGSLNDAQVQGYFGTSCYASSQIKEYADFIRAVGIARKGNLGDMKWSRGLKGRPLLQITANVKYHLSKSKEPAFLQFGYAPIKTINDVMVLKNSLYLPMGFTYREFITRSEFDSLPQIAKDAVLLQAVVLEDSTAQKAGIAHHKINIEDYSRLTTDSITAWRNRLMEDTLQVTKWKQDSFEGKISLKEPKILYFSILKNNNWKVKINDENRQLEKCNIGFSGIKLDAGDYDIKLYYEVKVQGIYKYQSYIYLAIYLIIFGIWLFFYKKGEKSKIVTEPN